MGVFCGFFLLNTYLDRFFDFKFHTPRVVTLVTMSVLAKLISEHPDNSTRESAVGKSDIFDISTEARKAVETVCFAGLTTLSCLLGIPANVMNSLVFWHQGLKDRMNLCLFSLAITDLFLLVCSLTLFSVGSFIGFYDGTLGEEYFLKTVVSLAGVTYAFRMTSGCITMIIAIERCVCVAFPLHAPNLLRTRTMGSLLLLCFLICQSPYVLLIFSRQVSFVKKGNSLQWILVLTEFYEQNIFVIQLLTNIVLGTAMPVITFSVVTITTIITVIKLKYSMVWRERSSLTGGCIHSQQMALTLMLVATSCVYIITTVPFVTWQVCRAILHEEYLLGLYYNLYMATSAVVNSCPLVNSSIHFFVYYLRSSRFRDVFHHICRYTKVPTFVFAKDFTKKVLTGSTGLNRGQ